MRRSHWNIAIGLVITTTIAGFGAMGCGDTAVSGATTDPCANGVRDGDETDTDCGGTCTVACALEKQCNIDKDCKTGVCKSGYCVNQGCDDGKKTGDETDLDCGGSCTLKCADTKGCKKDGDCQSNVCNKEQCAPPSCTDSYKNGNETDVNCGADCPACDDGKKCKLPSDCTSKLCTGERCAPATCDDKITNHGETDVDCGGATDCQRCADKGKCITGTDCTSLVCGADKKCAVSTCDDNQKNGKETDLDCGFDCGPGRLCAVGKQCSLGTDCDSKVCKSGKCADPQCGDSQQNGLETDVDCGGTTCGATCPFGKKCNKPGDCETGVCSNGTCGCGTGQKECSGKCAVLQSDVLNCGGCGSPCGTTNGSPSCDQGICKIACSPGWGNCNSLHSDGCEISTDSDTQNCGSCGKICDGSHGKASCTTGKCSIVCDAGYILDKAGACTDRVFGTGQDGSLNVAVDSTIDVPVTTVSELVLQGSNSIQVATTAAFHEGDYVLVMAMQGNTAPGFWEIRRVITKGTTQLTFDEPLERGYVPTDHVIVQLVRQYQDVYVETGATVRPAQPWDGATGGVLAFVARGVVTVKGTISVSGYGYRGGPVVVASCDPNKYGIQGEGKTKGPLDHSSSENSGGGGGGQANGCLGCGGGGGGNLSAGGGAGCGYVAGGGGATVPGAGGSAISSVVYDGRLFMGGGGGGAGLRGGGGYGGRGGGTVLIRAAGIAFGGAGMIAARGDSGSNTFAGENGGSGGGAGGTVLLLSPAAVSDSRIDLAGGSPAPQGFGPGGAGGAGVFIKK